MATTKEFWEIIRNKGLNAAEKERDVLKETILKKAGLGLDEFKRLSEKIESINAEFNEACRQLLGITSVSASPATTLDFSPHPASTQADWVIDIITRNGGKMYGPDLYDMWERTGGNRGSILTVVSKLIDEGKLDKSNKQEVRGRQRGSHLSISPQENEQK